MCCLANTSVFFGLLQLYAGSKNGRVGSLVTGTFVISLNNQDLFSLKTFVASLVEVDFDFPVV